MSTIELIRLASEHWKRLIQHQEIYIQAWIAETGLRPTECELVQEIHSEGTTIRYVSYVRRRTPAERTPPYDPTA